MTETAQPNQAESEEAERANPSQSSYFFHKHMIWGIIALLLLGIWFQFVPLIMVTSFLLFLSIIITVWKRNALKKVQPSLTLSKSRLFAGDGFHLEASVYNDKWLPLIWLEWEFPKHKAIMLGEEEQDRYLIRFLWLLWYQRVKWTIEGETKKRGVYELGEITLRSGDGFRFAEIEANHDLPNTLYVYPKLVPVHVPSFSQSLQWDVKGKQGGYLEDPLLVAGIRDYQPGDEFRKFNWRATARTGKLQTNVYQPVVSEQVMIYTDVSGFVIEEALYDEPTEQAKYMAKKEEQFETFLSVIASVAVKYNQQDLQIGYATNALTEKGKRMHPVLPSSNLKVMLDMLAKSKQSKPKGGILTSMFEKGIGKGPLFIFCKSVTEKHVLWYQQYKRDYPDIRFYYEIKTKYADKVNAHAIDGFRATAGSIAKES